MQLYATYEEAQPALYANHREGCPGTFRRIYQRRTKRKGERPKWSEIGYFCEDCLTVVLD